MSNLNETTNVQNSNDLSDLKQMFADYQKKSAPKRRKTSAEILAKYFVPRQSKETFRILPPKQGRKRIEEAFFHVVTLNAAGGKKKHGQVIYCPSRNDPKVPKMVNGEPALDSNNQPIMIPAPCPLCAKAKKILSQQDPSVKSIKKEDLTDAQKKIYDKNRAIFIEANKWAAKKFYIIRGIDRGQEKDGVKFWRFKHNFKKQGTLDKLLPILEDYVTRNHADFSSAENGTDLNIIMTDTEFNNHVYKQITAITTHGKSPLHGDPIVARQWLDDDITWRDVFLPKKAPNITPYEYLEMVAEGTDPYWDDIDQKNKHWVFPGRPDLETAANTRTRNLDADGEDESFEQASDLDGDYPYTTISNITEAKVGTYKDNAVDVEKSVLDDDEPDGDEIDAPDTDDDPVMPGEYDDLPF